MKLVQFEHETTDNDKAYSNDNRKDSDEQIVICSFILQIINFVFEVAFLVDAESSPDLLADSVHVITFEHDSHNRQHNQAHPVDYRNYPIALNAGGHAICDNFVKTAEKEHIEDCQCKECNRDGFSDGDAGYLRNTIFHEPKHRRTDSFVSNDL